MRGVEYKGPNARLNLERSLRSKGLSLRGGEYKGPNARLTLEHSLLINGLSLSQSLDDLP